MTFDDVDLEKLKNEIDEKIMARMPEADGYSAKVKAAMNYAISAGGKRIRPMLLDLTFRSFGGEGNLADPFLCAIEMVHTHSLIHDDLPALDNDMVRHGKPSVHAAFGEDIAILAGDALLCLAFETASQAMILHPGDQRVERSLSLLATKTGMHGMLGGQSADVILTGEKLTTEEMQYINKRKTAALIECALMIGGILGGASDAEILELKSAGRALGLAFQVRDDILDMTSSTEKLGKEAGQDARNQKVTYASLYGTEKAERFVREKTDMCLSILERMLNLDRNSSAVLLMKLVRMMAGRDF